MAKKQKVRFHKGDRRPGSLEGTLSYTKRMKKKPYKIARKNPKLGEHVYNIAAPRDIFGKGMVPISDKKKINK